MGGGGGLLSRSDIVIVYKDPNNFGVCDSQRISERLSGLSKL